MIDSSSFCLLSPGTLPVRESDFDGPEWVSVSSALDGMVALRNLGDDEHVLTEARAAATFVNLDASAFTIVEDDPEESPANRAIDSVFKIVRVKGPAGLVLTHAILHAYIMLLKEGLEWGGTNLEPIRWGRLRAAYVVLFDMLARRTASPKAAVPIKPPRPNPDGKRNALRRWLHAHYSFLVFVQGLIVVLNGVLRHRQKDHLVGARLHLERAITLMWGAESALRFAGDYAYTEYEKTVRPSMMPPAAPPGLSGLHWRDHEYLLSVLARLRPMSAACESALAPQMDALYQAIANTYDSHKYVCASFVGDEGTSLLMKDRTNKSAVDMLDRFKNNRLALIKK